MFYEYVYLDMEKIKQFALYLGIKTEENISGKREKGAKATLDAGVLSTEIQIRDEKNYQITPSDFTIFNTFKDKLYKEKIYFIDANDYENDSFISTLDRGKILKFDGMLKIPEQFGEIDFLQNILGDQVTKEILMGEIDIKEDSHKALFSLFFGKNKKSKIPVFFELGEYKLYSLLDREYLKVEDFSDFENLQNEEMTVYAKIEKVDSVEKDIEIVDIYKDVLGFNRAMRRGINTNSNSTFNDKITLCGKTIKNTIIAVLK